MSHSIAELEDVTLLSHRAAFGGRIRELRQARGLAQEEFAHTCGMDRTYISGIERGRRNPTLDVIVRIAQALEVDVADLFPKQPR